MYRIVKVAMFNKLQKVVQIAISVATHVRYSGAKHLLLFVDVPVKRKIEKNREKVLHHESVLKRNPYVQPIPSSLMSKKDKKKFKKHAKKKELQESREEKSVPMVLTVIVQLPFSSRPSLLIAGFILFTGRRFR